MNIYLSPHSDDVCFSIARLASRQGGELVTIFSRSSHVAARMQLPSAPATRAFAITQIRRGEDIAFAAATGLNRHDLGLAESSLLGRRSFDLSQLDQTTEPLAERLIPFLFELLPADSTPEDSRIYCPMGIGGHRDHQAVLRVMHAAIPRLMRRCTLWLYEDLHYASSKALRERGFRMMLRRFNSLKLKRTSLALGPGSTRQKMEWIGLYASQHARPPREEDYIPASGLASGLHEIVWEVASVAANQP